MANRIKGITIKYGGDFTSLQSGLKSLDMSLKNTQSNLRDINNQLKFDPHNTELLTQKHKYLSQAVSDTSERLDKLKEARKQAEANMGNYDKWKEAYEPVRKEIDKTADKLQKLKAQRDEMEKSGDINSDAYKALQAQIDETGNRLDELKKKQKEINDEYGRPISPEQYDSLKREIIDTENKLKDLERQAGESTVALQKIAQAGEGLQKAGDAISGIGKALAPVSGAAAVGLGAAAKAAIDYETALTGVMKTNDELIDENGNVIVSYEDLSDAIKDLSTRTAASKGEIAAVMEGAGQLGVGTEYLSDFTEAMVKLGDTTNLSADEASTAIAKFANITQMSLDNADRLGAALVDLGNNFATDEQSIMEMATRLAGAGHQIGLSEAQILGFATALSSVGIEAEMGGSAFSKAMIKMQVATETGQGAIDKINAKFLDVNAAINRNIADVKQDIANLQNQRDTLAEQGGAKSDAVKQIEAQIKEYEKYVKKSEAQQRRISQNADATGHSLESLQMLMYNHSKDFKELADSIGMTSKEMTALINSSAELQGFADVAQMSVDEFSELFRTDAPAAMDAFIRGLGDTDAAGESTIQMLQDMGFTEVRLRDTLTRAASAQDLFSDAVKAGTAAWDENSALTEEAEKRYGTTEAKLSQVRESITNIAIDLGEVLLPVIRDILEQVKKATDWFGTLDDQTKERIVKIGLLVAALSPLLMGLGSLISTVGTIMTLAPKIGAALTAAKTGIVALKGAVALFTGPVGIAVAAVGALAAAFITAYKKSETFRNGVNKVVGWIADKISSVKTWGKDLIDNFVSGLDEIPVVGAVTKIAKTIFDFLHFSEPEKGPLANFHTFAPDMIKLYAEGIEGSSGLVENAANAVAGLVKSGLDTVKDKLSDVKKAWEDKWGDIHDASKDAGERIAGKCAELNASITAFRGKFAADLDSAGGDADAFRDASTQAWDAVAKGADSLSGKLASAFESIRKSAGEMRDNVVNAFGRMRDSISEKIGDAKDWGKDLISNFTGGMDDNMEKLKTAADAVKTAVTDTLSHAADLPSVAKSLAAATAPVSDALSVPAPATRSNTAASQNAADAQRNAAYAAATQARRAAPVTFNVTNVVGGAKVSQLSYEYDAAEQARRGKSFIKR